MDDMEMAYYRAWGSRNGVFQEGDMSYVEPEPWDDDLDDDDGLACLECGLDELDCDCCDCSLCREADDAESE